tara:strand:- start:693 stop:1187 length:495 start_codon:yes stop_codon:yes gene_type:complete
MTKKWSSFEDDALIMESWRKHINEEDVEEERDQQPLDEIFGVAAAAAAATLKFFMAKMVLALFFGVQNRTKIHAISQNIQNNPEVPKEIKTLCKRIDEAIDAAAAAQPELGKVVEATGTKWNPLAIKANVLLAIIEKWTTPQPEEEEPPISAPTETTTTTPPTE